MEKEEELTEREKENIKWLKEYLAKNRTIGVGITLDTDEDKPKKEEKKNG